MNQTVTCDAVRLEGAQRLTFLPDLFGGDFMTSEASVYAYAQRYCPEYQGGFWQFYRLPEGGGYMAPDVESLTLCNPDTRFNDCNNWQVMAGGKRVLCSNRMYERFSDVKSGIVATINVCENSGSVTDKAMLEGAKVMMQVLDGYPSFAALAAHPKRITG